MKKGTVYWITGLSGAGKTTVSNALYKILKKEKQNIVLLDGDAIRDVFGNDLGYDINDRYKSALRNFRLCKFLSDQGIDVICATISMFQDIRDKNRSSLENYVEVYLKVPIEKLKINNSRNIYSTSNSTVSFEGKYDEPKNSDLVIENFSGISIMEIVEIILKYKKERLDEN